MKNIYKFTIYGRLDGLNEYTKSNRYNRYAGGKMKKDNEQIIAGFISNALDEGLLKRNIDIPVKISIDWYEPNERRDIDNIVFAQKFIFDALVQNDILEDDNRKCIKEITHKVFTDKDNPRIEVSIEEI